VYGCGNGAIGGRRLLKDSGGRQGSQSGVGALEGQGNAAEDAEGALGQIGCNKRKPILKIPLTGPAS
jgi:hypothetical protein